MRTGERGINRHSAQRAASSRVRKLGTGAWYWLRSVYLDILTAEPASGIIMGHGLTNLR